MTVDVAMFAALSKEALFDRSEPGTIAQAGGVVIDRHFRLPTFGTEIANAIRSIETFVVATDGLVTSMGTNTDLNAAWLPAVEALARQMHGWAAQTNVDLSGDAFVTASITPASEVNGEPHFDDAHFDPEAGVGLVAVVGDLGGPSAAGAPIPHGLVRPHQMLEIGDQVVAQYESGAFGRVDYGPNELVVLPQFGQLHSGPGPLIERGEVRHLLVYRVATTAR